MWRNANSLGLAALAFAAIACGAPERATALAGPPRRIVSLAPSITETLFALGAGDRLVGVCGQCNHPAEVARVPRVGGFVAPSVEAVLAAEPDLVVAVPSPGNREAVATVERAGVRVLVLADRTLADLWASIDALGAAVGEPARAAALAARLRGDLDSIHGDVPPGPRPRALLVVGHRPLVVAGPGTLQAELLDLVGADNAAADTGTAWPQLSLEVAMARAPDVVIDAGMGSEADERELGTSLRAGHVVNVPPDTLFRAGPRVVEAARTLAAAVHPAPAERGGID